MSYHSYCEQVLNFLLLDRRDENDLFGLANPDTCSHLTRAKRTKLQAKERALRGNRQKVRVIAESMLFVVPSFVLLFYLQVPDDLSATFLTTQLLCSSFVAIATASVLHLVFVALGLWCAARMAAFVTALVVLSKVTFDLVLSLSPTFGQNALTVAFFPAMFILMPMQCWRVVSRLSSTQDS